MNYKADCPANEANRVRVRVAFLHFSVGDTYCPPAGSVDTLVNRGLVERAKANPPEVTRELKSKGRAPGRYATR